MIDFKKHGFLIDTVCNKYGINTNLRKAHFLAQIDHETKSLTRLTENLNYSVEGLLGSFSRKRISLEQCKKYGRTPYKPADQQAIANIIYGGAFGKNVLGNILPNDGWKYRGRGGLMCTGKTNYENYSKHTGINFIDKPDDITLAPYYLDYAGYFWHINAINTYADLDNIIKVSRIINGGENGLSERIFLTGKYKRLLGD